MARAIPVPCRAWLFPARHLAPLLGVILPPPQSSPPLDSISNDTLSHHGQEQEQSPYNTVAKSQLRLRIRIGASFSLSLPLSLLCFPFYHSTTLLTQSIN